ncbi:MAG: TIGR03960 family B12-binding radical SAM protein [Deltaproteobacteria bacterium]|nr:TIGR03960 family B12-binding radical SAM protein [Deltaproteobacteria bacterium]
MYSNTQLTWDELNSLLSEVERPARYTGYELNSVCKSTPVKARIALCFPDLYEIAESYVGYKLLYHIVNQQKDYAAERVNAVAHDLERLMRERNVLLWSLETRTPLRAFDVVGFTLQYELAYPTILAMLELGGISLRSQHRKEDEPLVIGGGSNATNPEPIAPFFDAFLIGDGEEAILDIAYIASLRREKKLSRLEAIHELANIDGVYVPFHYDIQYNGIHVTSIKAKSVQKQQLYTCETIPIVYRRRLADLEHLSYPVKQIQPNVKPIHERFAIEIQRGCSRGCRFCQAGMIQRPVRQRSPDKVLSIAREALDTACVDTIGLLSLSAGDYGGINYLLNELLTLCEKEHVELSLPSLRSETLTNEIATRLNAISTSGFTIAPEAGSDRLRKLINKNNDESDLINAVIAAVSAGARTIKLYFMIGLPSEEKTDLEAIVNLAKKSRIAARQINRSASITVAVSTFVPKAHTPLQWERQITVNETKAKLHYLRDKLRNHRIQIRYHDPKQSYVEGVLARGDRQLADAIEKAMRIGCRLDGWSDFFDISKWEQAFSECFKSVGITADDYLEVRDINNLLAWDHLHVGPLKKFLRRERKRALQLLSTQDCTRSDRCYACGACDRADPYKKKISLKKATTELRQIIYSAPDVSLAKTDCRQEKLKNSLNNCIENDATENQRVRIRMRYQKFGAAVYFSQLETTSHILRAIRYSRMPVCYSQGYTPRPKVSFSPACPTGISSSAEYFDCLCKQEVSPMQWVTLLNNQLAEGLHIFQADLIDEKATAVSEKIRAITYAITIDSLKIYDAQIELNQFLARTTQIMQVARKKVVHEHDVRKAVQNAILIKNELILTVSFSVKGALKIREVLNAIFSDVKSFVRAIHKKELQFEV